MNRNLYMYLCNSSVIHTGNIRRRYHLIWKGNSWLTWRFGLEIISKSSHEADLPRLQGFPPDDRKTRSWKAMIDGKLWDVQCTIVLFGGCLLGDAWNRLRKWNFFSKTSNSGYMDLNRVPVDRFLQTYKYPHWKARIRELPMKLLGIWSYTAECAHFYNNLYIDSGSANRHSSEVTAAERFWSCFTPYSSVKVTANWSCQTLPDDSSFGIVSSTRPRLLLRRGRNSLLFYFLSLAFPSLSPRTSVREEFRAKFSLSDFSVARSVRAISKDF